MAEGEDQSSSEQQNWSGEQGNKWFDCINFEPEDIGPLLNTGDGPLFHQSQEDFPLPFDGAVAEYGGSSETVIPVANQNAIVAIPLAETQVYQHQLQTTVHFNGLQTPTENPAETYVTQDHFQTEHQFTAVSNVQRKRCTEITGVNRLCEEHAVAGAKFCISHLQDKQDKIKKARAYISRKYYGDNVSGKRCLKTGPSGQCEEDAVGTTDYCVPHLQYEQDRVRLGKRLSSDRCITQQIDEPSASNRATKEIKSCFKVQVKAGADNVQGKWKFEIDSTIKLHEMIRLTAQKTHQQEGSFTMLYQDFDDRESEREIRLVNEENLVEAIDIAKSRSNILSLHLVFDKK